MWGPESADDPRLGQKSLLVFCLIVGCGFSVAAEWKVRLPAAGRAEEEPRMGADRKREGSYAPAVRRWVVIRRKEPPMDANGR